MDYILLKSPKQIQGIRRSCKLAAKALDFIAPFVTAGVTTGFLNDKIAEFIKEHGAVPAPLNYKGYPKETCISLNEVICHGIPDDRTLVDGDILNIDVTTILDGYYGDTSRMFTVGTPSPDAAKIMKVAKECLDIGIRQVRPDYPLNRIGYAITHHAHKNGCSVVREFCGHGVGLDFHEAPQVIHFIESHEKNTGPILKPGMTFTIEPMINLGAPDCVIDEVDKWTARTADKSLSAQYEHTVLVNKYGCEILTGGI